MKITHAAPKAYLFGLFVGAFTGLTVAVVLLAAILAPEVQIVCEGKGHWDGKRIYLCANEAEEASFLSNIELFNAQTKAHIARLRGETHNDR